MFFSLSERKTIFWVCINWRKRILFYDNTQISISFLKELCIYVCGIVHMSSGTCRGQKKAFDCWNWSCIWWSMGARTWTDRILTSQLISTRTSLYLHDLCSLWSFLGAVSMKQTLVNCFDFSKLQLPESHRNIISRSNVALVLGNNLIIMKT